MSSTKFATVSTTSLIRRAIEAVDGNASRAYDAAMALRHDHSNATIAAAVILKAAKRAGGDLRDLTVEITGSGFVAARRSQAVPA